MIDQVGTKRIKIFQDLAKAGIGKKEANMICCAECKKEFSWEQAYHQRNTPGSEQYNPPGGGNFRPRAFCPNCGSLVAEWYIDRSEDSNRWKWYGDNVDINKGKDLPRSPLTLWGHPITRGSEAPFEVVRIDVKKVKTII